MDFYKTTDIIIAMENIEQAINFFNTEKYIDAENIALKLYKSNIDTKNAIDVLAAIYLRTNNLEFIKKNNKNDLPLIRELAIFLAELKTDEAAIFFYKKALELEPNDIVGLNNIALLYENLEKTNEAKEAYQKSIKIKENYPAIYNLGVLYRKLKDLKNSEKFLKMALNFNSEEKYTNYSLGMTYLMNKDFYNGYKFFLKRPVKNAAGLRNFWDGKTYPDKILLVFCEYGLGDAIMFSRYFPLLKNYFKKVKVCCHPSLVNIFKKSFENIEFITSTDTDYDFCTFVMDLPYKLGLDFDNIPGSEGYLKVEEAKVLEYKEKYFNTDLKKVGIFYIGGETEKRNAKYRSMLLEELSPIFKKEEIKVYSFQKEDIFDELKNFPEIIDLGKTFNDFSDTAAAMKNLDLFITIDSAPVHLAGALGIKTFLMLPYYSEWRWFLDEKVTPWYNSVELFRQTTPCNWQEIVKNIHNKI